MEDDETRGLHGLEFARNLNFTEAQYEEARKMISSPYNTNQLLVALIDVVDRRDDTCCASQSAGATNVTNVNHHQQVVKSRNVNLTLPANSVQESNSSSCYSSMTSFPSSSDQSLDSLQQNHPVTLRKIYIDGSNVARTHSKDASFSWLGIKIAVDWFLERKHLVRVFIPEDRCHPPEDKCLRPEDLQILNYLQKLDVLVETPSGCNDDLFVIEAARRNNGVIVSNDLYRDEIRLNELQRFIHLNRLRYVFVDHLFIPAQDPRGRAGPMLDDFLRVTPEVGNVHGKLYRAKSHQRYQRNGSVKQNQNPSAFHSQRLSLQSTRSLPVEQSRNSLVGSANQLINGLNHRQQDDHNDQLLNCHNHNRHYQRQQVRRAISVAHTNTISARDNSDIQEPFNRRKALCSSKSHDV